MEIVDQTLIFMELKIYSRGINYDIRSDKLMRDWTWMWGWQNPENDVEKLNLLQL